MEGSAAPVPPAKPAEGAHCPRCNNGILFKIGENADGVYLRCFNCDTSGTVHKTEEWVPSIDGALGSPTGFQLTHDQLAGKGSIDVEQSTQRARAGTPATPAAAAVEQGEPHEQHDVVPPRDDQQQQGGGGDGA